MIVEAGQELEGPSGRCLHRVRVLIVGRWNAAADADADAPGTATTTGTPVTDAGGVTTGVINAVAGDGDDAAEPVADLLPLRHRRHLLPL